MQQRYDYEDKDKIVFDWTTNINNNSPHRKLDKLQTSIGTYYKFANNNVKLGS